MKMDEIERATAEVALFNEYVRGLEIVHVVEVAEVDWEGAARTIEPGAPGRSTAHESAAQADLNGFRPRLLETKKRQATRLQTLTEAVPKASRRDDSDYEIAQTEHAQAVEQWRDDRALAEGVLSGDIEACASVAEQIQDVAGGEYMRYMNLAFSESSMPAITVGVIAIEDIVPARQKSLLASGRLSEKQMPKGRYFGLYQDYVCGAALLAAKTVLGMLPVSGLVVTAETERLDTATGHYGETAILSIYVQRDTMARLNLAMVDASDAMTNFPHNMKFLKTKGFATVERITAPPVN